MIDVENIVLSRIMAKMPSAIKTKFPNLSYTTSDITKTEPSFPNIYVHLMDFSQLGQTIDNKKFNGGEAFFQIEVVDNTSQVNVRKVMNAVIDIVNGSMGFDLTYGPQFINTADNYRQVVRFKRIVMENEKL